MKYQIEAKIERIQDVLDFVRQQIEPYGCPIKIMMQLEIAVEEIFVNIANYAYTPNEGEATIEVDVDELTRMVKITFIDRGYPYNPLEKKDPDTTLSASEREIGGLGVYMVKKSMDKMDYEYSEGKNILVIYKQL